MKRASLIILCSALQLTTPGVMAALSPKDFQQELRNGREALSKNYGKLACEIYSRLLKEDANNAEILYGMGKALKIDGKATAAQDYLERSLKIAPNQDKTLSELGEIYSWKENSRARAIELLTQAVKLNSQSLQANKILGLTLSWRQETLGQSLQYLSKAESLDPLDQAVELALARAYSWTGNREKAETAYRRALLLKPDDPDALYELALILSYRQGRRDEALELLKRTIELAPANTQARFAEAMISAWAGRYKESLPKLKALKNENKKLKWQQGNKNDQDLSIALALAKVLSWSREYDESEKILKEILAEEPESIAAQKELGMILSYQYAKRAEAIGLLEKVTAAAPADLEAKLALAQAEVAMQYPEKAKPLIEFVLSKENDNALAWKVQGNIYACLKEPAKAIESLERAAELGLFDSATAAALAGSYLALKNSTAAEKICKKALKEGAEDPKLQVLLAKALIMQKRTNEALELLYKLSKEDELFELAKISEEFTGPAETRNFAIDICRQTLAKDPQNTHCLWSLGKVLSWNLKTRDEAILLLERYQTLKPDDLEARRYLGEVLSWAGKKKEALAIYNKLLEIDPTNLNIQASRAQVLSWLGKINPAIKQYKSILKKNPRHKEALVGLGQCLNWQGDNLKSEAVFKKAISYYPEAPDLVLEEALNYQRLGRLDLALDGAKKTIQLFEEGKGL
ncbi:MAG: tetratricopeptide repeat protein [Candidatus Obscuribacterales bacterium]|nr:tetratricopeptide repeat protein [Candidatus Obscuribacterales bacterium]